MIRSSAIAAFLLLCTNLILSACSNQSLYNSFQHNAQEKCRELFGTAYDECIKENSKNFQEYQREKDTILEKESQ